MGRWRVSISTAIGHNAPADGESSNQLLSKDQSAGSHVDNNSLVQACTLSAGDVECATFSQLFTPGRVAILFKTVFGLILARLTCKNLTSQCRNLTFVIAKILNLKTVT